MLAEGVEAQLAHTPDVALVFLRLRGQEKAVLKVPLVQNAVEIDRLAVETEPRMAARLPQGDGAQGEIAGDPIRGGLHGEIV